jgi:hypothetical protein
MKSLAIFLLIGFSLFIFSSCKTSHSLANSSQNDQQILPLKVGDTWVFRYTHFDTTGAIQKTVYDTLMISTDTLVAGDTWYEFSTHNGRFYTNKPDGLWMMAGGTYPITPTLLYKYPASVGDSWNTSYANSMTLQVSVEQVNVSLTVPQGKYPCYEYRTSYNSKPQEDDYFCPGVGFIADDYYSYTNSGRMYKGAHRELVSVTLK